MTDLQPTPQRSFLKSIFLSPDEPRLRAGWRLAIQTVLLIVLGFCFGLPIGLLALIPGLELSDGLFLALSQVVEIIAVTLSVFLARRFLDKRSFSSLGLKLDKWTAIDIFTGIAITFFMMGSIYLIQWGVGWLTFDGFAWETDDLLTVLGGTLGMLVVFIFVGWNEELLSRGYHLQTLASGLSLFWGVVISSAIFGLLHLGNPNATWISAAGIFLAGVFLAYGYLATKQLWLPIGLHIGWNFFEGVVFGFPVSGLDIYRLTRITVSGPELWTGGAFGPEAGLIVLPGLLLGAVLIFVYAQYVRNSNSD
ncbi:MAG: CPBP family intramembrane metalloprotease [Anaerolineales bacterium]|nr:CPBP family intramembrane metalloprotease [Anaerolineales bacterium]